MWILVGIACSLLGSLLVLVVDVDDADHRQRSLRIMGLGAVLMAIGILCLAVGLFQGGFR